MPLGKDRAIKAREQEIQRLQVNLDTASVDRDYYRRLRDEALDREAGTQDALDMARQQLAETRQALRQIIQAVESESDDKLDAILRIARTNSGA